MQTTVAAFQMDIVHGDKQANMNRIRMRDACAGEVHPAIIVLPELWSTSYVLEKAEKYASESGCEEADFLGAWPASMT